MRPARPPRFRRDLNGSPRLQESQGDREPMYAIVQINGVQTKVSPDETLDVPRLKGKPGDKLTFDRVMLVSDGDKITVGQPFLTGASLTAEVVDHRWRQDIG